MLCMMHDVGCLNVLKSARGRWERFFLSYKQRKVLGTRLLIYSALLETIRYQIVELCLQYIESNWYF